MSSKLIVIFVLVALLATFAACSTKPDATPGATVLSVHEDVATLEEMHALEEESLLAHAQNYAAEDAAVLSARTEKSKRKLDATVESLITKRLIPHVRGAQKTCSFSCDHKQSHFLGCSCKASITFTTSMAKCPTDVTRVSSTDIQWAWNQCAVQLKKDCNCPTLPLIIRQHRATVAGALVAENPSFNSKDSVLTQAVTDVFTSKVLGFLTDDFKTNTKRYVNDVVDELSRQRRYNEYVAKMKEETKRLSKVAADLTENVEKMYGVEADSRAKAVVDAASKFSALQKDAQGKFGQTAPEVVNTVQKYERIVAQQASSKNGASTKIAQNPLIRDLIKSLKLERKLARAAFKTSQDAKVKEAAKATIKRTNKQIKQLKAPKCKKAKKSSKKGKKIRSAKKIAGRK